MSDYDHGPLQAWEITWKSGHVETVQGHQVIFESTGLVLAGALDPMFATARQADPRFMIHGQFGPHWRLVIAAPEADLLSIRNVTGHEAIAAPEVTS